MQKAIIIGASSGIGEGLAKVLAENNYIVGITGRRQYHLEQLALKHPNIKHVSSFDCTTENNSEKLTELAGKLGGLDLLILSSGRGDVNYSLDYDIENRTNQLNVVAFTEIADWAYHYFTKKGEGHFVGITSIAGLRGSRLAPAYNASKAYQINYLEGLRQKVNKTGKPIIITDIRPGFVDTAMAKGDGVFWVAPVEKTAKQIFSKIRKKKDLGYVTKRWILLATLMKLIPRPIYKRL